MKKILLIALCVVLSASSAFALIAGSKHDLSSATYYGGSTQSSCQYCHAPHHAVTGAPLWNRSNPNPASYTLYGAGSTLSGTPVGQPGTNSLTCLSCHDGTIGVGDIINGTDDTITGAALTGGKINSTAAGYIGTDLSTSHPVGVVYNTAASLAGLNTTITVSGSNATIGGKKWKIYGGGNNVGKVECGSCHDPHNTTAGQMPFLKDTKNSICADCHSLK